MFWEGIELPPDIEDSTPLSDVLDDDYILQRCRERSASLITYLSKSERINELIDLVTDQSNIRFDVERFKRPSIAAEILSSDVPQLLDFLVSSGQGVISSSELSNEPTETSKAHRMPFVDNLLSFLDTPETLNPLSASFFSKILINLLSFRAAELVPYLKARSDFFPNILQHLDTSAISDLLVELAQQDNGQQHAVAKWFLEANLIPKLLDELSTNSAQERHEHCARCLCELYSIFRNHIALNAPDHTPDSDVVDPSALLKYFDSDEEKIMFQMALEVLDQLESEATLGRLLDLLIEGSTKSASVITSVCEVLLTCVDKAKSPNGLPPGAGEEFNENSFESLTAGLVLVATPGRQFLNRLATKANCPLLQQRSRRTEATAASMLIPRLPDLHKLLQTNTNQTFNTMKTTAGTLSPPLGRGRLSLINLIVAMCQLNDQKLKDEVCRLNFIPLFMQLFEQYPFNTFLHRAVADLFTELLYSHDRQHPQNPSPVLSPADAKDAEQPFSHPPNVPKETAPISGTTVSENNSLLQHLLYDCKVIDWILRLSCIPRDRPKSEAGGGDPSEACRLSTRRPKPGFSGHLWQIAHAVSTRFPSIDSLPPPSNQLNGVIVDSFSSWDEFVKGDLAAILQAQTLKPDEEEETAASMNCTLEGFQLNAQRGLQDVREMIEFLRGPSGPDFSALTSGLLLGGRTDGLLSGLHAQDRVFTANDWVSRFKGKTGASGGADDDDILDNDEEEEEEEQEEDEEEPNANSSSSDEEEDLKSPVVIRQRRHARSVPASQIFMASPLEISQKPPADEESKEVSSPVKPVDTSVTPWSTAPSQPDAQFTSSADDDSWANFESAFSTTDSSSKSTLESINSQSTPEGTVQPFTDFGKEESKTGATTAAAAAAPVTIEESTVPSL
uniref:Serine/threonine-protein phosphatase 6 regulatory subunit 3 n=1 Tax=Schistocephalus solidus TaxID=70667 RepID=A0A0X3Q9M8_SCHSO